MLTQLSVLRSGTIFGLVVSVFFGCSTVYRLQGIDSLSKEDLAALVLPATADVKVFSVDGVKGPNEVGPPYPDEREFGSGSSGGVRIELLPGKHILRIGYYEQIPGMIGQAIRYSLPIATLEFEAEKGRTYTVRVQVSGDQWKARVVELKGKSHDL